MVFEKNVAVAATALIERPPFSCHSNIIFEHVAKPMVLTTFCVGANATNRESFSEEPFNTPEPLQLCEHWVRYLTRRGPMSRRNSCFLVPRARRPRTLGS